MHRVGLLSTDNIRSTLFGIQIQTNMRLCAGGHAIQLKEEEERRKRENLGSGHGHGVDNGLGVPKPKGT